MNNKFRNLWALAALVGLTACGSVPGLSDFGAMKTGTQVSDEQMASIIDKKSTQSEVLTKLGHPNRKAQAGGTTSWYYDFNQIGQAYIGKNINETTVFEFNSKGIVTAHYKTGGQPGTSDNALLKAAGK